MVAFSLPLVSRRTCVRFALWSLRTVVFATTVFWVATEIAVASVRDGNGNPISRYEGVYGYAGGAIVQVVVVDGWAILHVVTTRGTYCAIERPGIVGVDLGGSPYEPIAFALAPSGASLEIGSDAFPRRPRLAPHLESMWILDARSSTLSSCAPTPLERSRMLAMTVLGSKAFYEPFLRH